ncbi:HPP family protein [Pseudomonadota bacterium]
MAVQPRQSHQEILLSAVGALVAISLVAWVSHPFLSNKDLPFMVASMGASAVLLFAVPSSPMNHPWALVASHLFCAIVGVSCAQAVPDVLYAVPLTITLSILVMHYLRCLHPPGGATAMLMVLGGPDIVAQGYQLVFTPVALNALILLLAAVLIKCITDASRQSHEVNMPSQWLKDSPHKLEIKPPFEPEDIKAALRDIGTYIDVKESELFDLYRLASHRRYQRNLGDLKCSDFMIANPVGVEYGTKLGEAWRGLEENRLTALPVVDRVNHVIGMVSVDDFIAHANKLELDSLEVRIKALVTYTSELTSDKPEVVGQIMSSDVISSSLSSRLTDLLPIMDERDIHHVPVVDDNNKLVGVISRDEVVAFMAREVAGSV